MLSVVILTFNSEKYLREVLKSASWADEIVVVDSGSKDGTKAICDEFKNARFITQSWLGFGAQKQFGVNVAKNEWIFVLDSDEIITDALKNEILATLNAPKFCAYRVGRLNYFFGRAVRNLGLYPDFSVRFFNRNFAGFDGREIHEKVVLKSEILGEKFDKKSVNSGENLDVNSGRNSDGNSLANSQANSGEISSENDENLGDKDVKSSRNFGEILDVNSNRKFGGNSRVNSGRNFGDKSVNSSGNSQVNSGENSLANLGGNSGANPNKISENFIPPNSFKIAIGTLENHFIHYAYESIEQFIAKQNRYSSLGAKKSKFKAIFSPIWMFFKLYFLKSGWREGWRGYVIAKLYAQYTFWKYIK